MIWHEMESATVTWWYASLVSHVGAGAALNSVKFIKNKKNEELSSFHLYIYMQFHIQRNLLN